MCFRDLSLDFSSIEHSIADIEATDWDPFLILAWTRVFDFLSGGVYQELLWQHWLGWWNR